MVLGYSHGVKFLLSCYIINSFFLFASPCTGPPNCFTVTNVQLTITSGWTNDFNLGQMVDVHLDVTFDVLGTDNQYITVPAETILNIYLAADNAGSSPFPSSDLTGTTITQYLTFDTTLRTLNIDDVTVTIDLTAHGSCDFSHVCFDLNPKPGTWSVHDSSTNAGCLPVNCISPITTSAPQAQVTTTLPQAQSTATMIPASNTGQPNDGVALIVEDLTILYDREDFLDPSNKVTFNITFFLSIYSISSVGVHGDSNWKVELYLSEIENGQPLKTTPVELTVKQLAADLALNQMLSFNVVKDFPLPTTSNYTCVGIVYCCVKVQPHPDADWVLDTQFAKNIRCRLVHCPSEGISVTQSIGILTLLVLTVLEVT